MYYHLGQCLCPYAFDVDPQVYKDMVEEIKGFLSGGHTEIQDRLQEKMAYAAAHMEFEKLQNFAIKLKRLKQL